MAKLIVLALAFAALVAFASAYSTIITTTIEEENSNSRQQCSRQIQGERFNECEKYLQQGRQSWNEKIIPGMMQGDLQSCCQELRNVDDQCQCEAVKQAFRQAQRMQQQQQGRQQGGSFGSQQIRELKQKAQNLPNQCSLRTRQCQIGTISMTTTTTTVTEEKTRGSPMCQRIRGRQFQKCQTYIQKQSGSLLMNINRQGQQTQYLQECCNELENVDDECQCEAMQEVYRQAEQQQLSQQPGSRGGSQSQTQDLQRIVQNLRNQCKLQAQQCQISSTMF